MYTLVAIGMDTPFKIYENFTLVCFLKENNHIYAVSILITTF